MTGKRKSVEDSSKISKSLKKKKVKKSTDSEDSESEISLKKQDIEEEPNLPPSEVISKLLTRIEDSLPKDDNVKYDSRAKKLNWEAIAWEELPPGECQRVWNYIQERIRRFRILAEMIPDAREWINHPWTNFYKSKGHNRHPDIPKKPLSMYMLFYSEKRSEILRTNPNLSMPEVAKVCSELYGKLSEKKKSKYKAKCDAMRADYEKKLAAFYTEHPSLKPLTKKEAEKSRKAQKDLSELPKSVGDVPFIPGAPEKPSKPYELFVKAQMESLQGSKLDKGAFSEDCRRSWKELKFKKKAKWIKLAADSYRLYEDKLMAFEAEHPNYLRPPMSSKNFITLEDQKILDKVMGRPEKPPSSAYSLFSKEMLNNDTIKKFPSKERMAAISEQWKILDPASKDKYQSEVSRTMALYRQAYEDWFNSLSEEDRKIEANRNSSTKSRKSIPNKEPILKNPKEEPLNSLKVNILNREPVEPLRSAKKLFLQDYISSKRGRIEEGRQAWESLAKSLKRKWRDQLEPLRNEYIEAYTSFVRGLNKTELELYTELKQKRDEEAKSSSDEDSDDSSSSESDSE